MSDKLIKRLFEHSEHPVTGTMVLTNPDGPAAADEIERLRAENSRMRAALKTIRDTFQSDIEQGYKTKDKTFAVAITRDALEGEGGTK